MKKILLIAVTVLLSVSTLFSLEPLKVAYYTTSTGVQTVHAEIKDYSSGSTLFVGENFSLTPNSNGIVIVNIQDHIGPNGDLSGINASTINTSVTVDVYVGTTLHSQHRLDNLIFDQASTTVFDNSGNFNPPTTNSSLGTDPNRWQDAFVGSNTLHVGPNNGMTGGTEMTLSYDEVNNKGVIAIDGTTSFEAKNTGITIPNLSGVGNRNLGVDANGNVVINTSPSVTAGDGLTLSTNTLDVVGSATIIANANDVEVNSSGTANQVLLSSGTVGSAATYGALPLGDVNAVSGTLPVANGGTGATTLTTGNFLQGNGTGAVTATKAVPTGAVVGTTDAQTLTNKTIDANSNTITNIFPDQTGNSGKYLTTDGTNVSWGAFTAGAFTIDAANNKIYRNDLDDDFIFGDDDLNWTSGTETKMFYDDSKGAFRVGTINNVFWDEINTGDNSFAAGFNTVAAGKNSVAIGSTTTAGGDESTAMGYYTVANGDYSTSLGHETEASGLVSTAMGSETIASGVVSTALGGGTIASGEGSTAMGIETEAIGTSSTAMGGGSIASGDSSTAIGIETTASGLASTAMGSYTTASGDGATTMGRNTTATEPYSVAMGFGTTASGNTSTAMGSSTTAIGDYSTAMGSNTNAKSFAETTIGTYSTDYTPDTDGATQWNATDRLFVIGNGTGSSARSDALVMLKNGDTEINGGVTIQDDLIVGDATMEHGGGTETKMFFDNSKGAFRVGGINIDSWDEINTGDNSFAAGFNTVAAGENSVAIGSTTNAGGDESTAMGYYTVANGDYSTSLGFETEASGNVSLAMGTNTIASGAVATAMGSETEASGDGSTAMGSETVASGTSSTAMGGNTIADANNSVAMGKYNDNTVTDELLTIGNGTNNANRSNAFEVYDDGDVVVGNDLTVSNLAGTGDRNIGVDANGKLIELAGGGGGGGLPEVTVLTKSSDQVVSSPTFVNITDITASLDANSVYQIKGLVAISFTSFDKSPYIKLDGLPTSGVIMLETHDKGRNISQIANTNEFAEEFQLFNGTSYFPIDGIFQTGSSGTFNLQLRADDDQFTVTDDTFFILTKIK